MINQELKNLSYEELVQLRQDGNISLIELIESMPELAEEWSEWKTSHSDDDISAKYFLAQYEDNMMNNVM